MESPYYTKTSYPSKKRGKGNEIIIALALMAALTAILLFNTNASYGTKTPDCESRIQRVWIKDLSPGCVNPRACTSAALYKYKTYYTDMSTGRPVCVEKTDTEILVKCYKWESCAPGIACGKEYCVDVK